MKLHLFYALVPYHCLRGRDCTCAYISVSHTRLHSCFLNCNRFVMIIMLVPIDCGKMVLDKLIMCFEFTYSFISLLGTVCIKG